MTTSTLYKTSLTIAAVVFASSVAVGQCLAADTDGPWTVEAAYTADLATVVSGDQRSSSRFLDNLDIIVEGDLDRLLGWRGAKVHAYLLNNNGGEPNDAAATLQGIDNIEVAEQGARLYEFWVEQEFGGGRGSLLAGLYDVNSEFYATAASDLLIAPSFGIGSELAATGPNGPSIFPSTALAARVRVGEATGRYLQIAAVNAEAGSLGDAGVDTNLDHGALYLAEAGWTGPMRLAVGGWRYGERQDDIRDISPLGQPVATVAEGIYALAEGTLYEAEQGLAARAFLRAGASDGDTTDFRGGWQAGLRLDHVVASRPDSAFSFGVHQGLLSNKARANLGDAGVAAASAEQGLEITYADTVGRVTFQPSLQWIDNPGGDRDAKPVVAAIFRVSIALK